MDLMQEKQPKNKRIQFAKYFLNGKPRWLYLIKLPTGQIYEIWTTLNWSPPKIDERKYMALSLLHMRQKARHDIRENLKNQRPDNTFCDVDFYRTINS